jgi:probable rRNA maturation factor
MARITLHLHNATDIKTLPSAENFNAWVDLSYQEDEETEVSIRLIDIEEMSELNEQYRKKSGPTNVLSFPDDDEFSDEHYLGDIAICAPIVNQEAIDQGKSPMDHWAHMSIHAMLHLQGFDHVDEKEAKVMESLERALLDKIGVSDPYQ